MITGLTSAEAVEQLKLNGFNELPSGKPKNIWHIALEVIKEPMFLLLISCGTLYILLGNKEEGITLLSTIIIIIAITFFQYRKTERALEALKQLSSPRVIVIRDNREIRIAGREVVPGDIIVLNEGDRVPADASIVEGTNLCVDESLLTGESLPIEKDAANSVVYSGTLVVRGKGIAKVTSTGLMAQLGKIATSIKDVKEQPTSLQNEMKTLIRRLAIIGIVLSLTVVTLFYITRGNLLKSILNGLSAAMAILPEEFPVVLTVFLALGAWRLSKKNVLTRKPSAIETLGSTTVLCSDKTGTITQNKMDIAVVYDGNEIIERKDFQPHQEKIKKTVSIAWQACPDNSVDPMEKAMEQLYKRVAPKNSASKKLIKEYPLSKEQLSITRVLLEEKENVRSVSSKGAPETIFALCRLSQAEIARHSTILNQLAGKGYRVIGVASAQVVSDLPKEQSGFHFMFEGLLALEDPVRPEVPKAIEECKHAGIRVVMITGDFSLTAKSIGDQIGLPTQHILSGDEIQLLTDTELQNKVRDVHVFARVKPEQKLKIVKALQGNAEIVAMTGDGINDAPALKAANIGIAMGNKGTDVAREASSLVLLDDNFASIVAAIRSGRRIFDNLQKAMSYIIAIHIPIIGLTLLPSFIPSLPLFLLPLHIVFMELIIDPVSSIAFEYEQEEANVMNRPPRNPNEKFFGFKKIIYSILQGVLLLLSVIIVHLISGREGHSEGEVRAIAFSTLIIGNVFLAFTNMSNTRTLFSVFAEGNKAAIIILFSALALLVLAIVLPPLQSVFNFEFPGFSHFIPAIIAVGASTSVLELIKFFRMSRRKSG